MMSDMIHGTSVAVGNRAVLIIGPSGSGKSALALQLIAFGAQLVSDDQTCLRHSEGEVFASAPPSIRGLIEARGLGLIQVPTRTKAPIRLCVDMSQNETMRLPEPHWHSVLGVTLPCLHNVDSSHFASAVFLYMKGGQGGKQ